MKFERKDRTRKTYGPALAKAGVREFVSERKTKKSEAFSMAHKYEIVGDPNDPSVPAVYAVCVG